MSIKTTITRKRKDKVIDDYNHEASFPHNRNELSDQFVESMLSNRNVGVNYTTKTISSGNLFEVEIYPHFKKGILLNGIIMKQESSEAQRNLNNRNSRKRLMRLVHENFETGDYWITFTFTEDDLPNGFKDMARIRRNFFTRLNRLRKKKGLENARYVYVEEEGTFGTERFHIHMVMDSDLSKEEIESKWKYGRVQIRTITYRGDKNLIGICKYMCKDPETYKKTAFRTKGKREWGASKGNLKMPVTSHNRSKFKKKHVNEMVRNQNSISEMLEQNYPDHYFKEAEVRYNDYNGLFYIYAIMEDKRNQRRRM